MKDKMAGPNMFFVQRFYLLYECLELTELFIVVCNSLLLSYLFWYGYKVTIKLLKSDSML